MLSMRSMVPSPRGPATPGNTTTTVSSNNTTAGSFSYHQALVLGLLEKRRRPPTNKPTFDSSTTMNTMMPIAYGGYSTGPLVDVMSYSNNSSVMGSQCLQMNSEVLQMQPSANSFTCTVRTSSEHGCPQERVSSVVALMTPEQQKCSQRPPRAFTIEAILGLDRPLEHHKHSNYHHHHLQRLHHHHHHVHRATSLQHHLQSVDKRACWTNNCISPDSQTSINLPLSNSNNLSTTTTVTAETVAKIAPKRKHSSSGCKELKRSLSSTADGSSGDEICEKPTKSKRVRTIFTPEQLERLEGEFERQQYMVGSERLYLAASLNLTEAQVKVWFQNRRIKWRRQHLALQQARLAKIRASDDNEDEIKDCALEDTYGDSNDEADLNDETSCSKGAFPKYTNDL